MEALSQTSPLLRLVHPYEAPRSGGAAGRHRLGSAHFNHWVIAAVIALALVAPVLVLGQFTYTAVTEEFGARSARERVGTAELAANLVDETLVGAGEALRQVGTRPSLRDALRRREVVAVGEHLSDLRLSSAKIANASAFDARGFLLQRDPPSPEFLGRDFSDRDYIRGAMSSSTWYVSDAYVARIPAGAPFASVSLAVRDGPEFLGTLSVALQPAQILSALRPITGTTGRELLIVDGARQVVASSDATRPLASVIELPGLEQSLARKSGTLATKLGGKERILTFAPVQSSLWSLYLVDDPVVVLAAGQRLSDQVRLAGIAAAVLALIVGVLFSFSFRALSLANRRALEAAAHQAFTDGLTGLFNRHFMAEQLGLLHGAATRGRCTYSVVALDADGLKRVNDSYGHETGDLALRRLAGVVRRNIRAMDIAVRTGGDEFVVIMPDTSLAGASRAAEHIVAAADAERRADPRVSLTVSAGVAEWREDRTAEDVLHAADLLLVQAKRAGKGRAISLFDPAYALP